MQGSDKIDELNFAEKFVFEDVRPGCSMAVSAYAWKQVSAAVQMPKRKGFELMHAVAKNLQNTPRKIFERLTQPSYSALFLYYIHLCFRFVPLLYIFFHVLRHLSYAYTYAYIPLFEIYFNITTSVTMPWSWITRRNPNARQNLPWSQR